MADNSIQLRWIVYLYCNFCWLFHGRNDVAVHGNMFWYVDKDDPDQRQAPDVMIIFGRPPGERGSYLSWEEDQVPVTVVFEILSPSNTVAEMTKKQEFYEYYGVEEYYEYDPEKNTLTVFCRRGEAWIRVRRFASWVSPRLGVKFDLANEDLVIETVKGQRFFTFEEAAQQWLEADKRTKQADERADAEKQRADAEKQRADQAEQRSQRLRELILKVRRGQATAEELQELDQLEP